MPLAKTPFHAARLLLFTFLSWGLLAGCSSNKPDVSVNEQTNFAGIDSFYVQPPLNSVNANLENHIVTAITSVLQSKGIVPADKNSADVRVGFFPATNRDSSGKSVSFGLGTSVFGSATGLSLGSIFSVPLGEQSTQYQTLQIDVVQNGEFVYSASGRTQLEAQDSIAVQRELTELVRKLLASYPAKNAGAVNAE
ncbi:DUF4136 domain-containing protein [Salinimonas marina]|uniref:DUF4136 domain-containing protein n=1 Tax=Salinimonas marina TaxID=2785918 RepID=A0A7S9HDG2_9ALTE|nr:DUF4136 domain-containing protein [Salinimonas marina]QPG05536.1 DUF4136 domain-containing protein [Salinimonas marina]